MTRAAVILAAGMGTRMKSAKPKVMHEVAGLPILGHVIAAARGAGVERIVVVTSPDGAMVRDFAQANDAQTAIQDKQLGTGHAAAAAASALSGFGGEVVICYGDMPLMTAKTLEASFEARKKAGLAIVAFHSKSTAYGRVIADKDGLLDRIVEYRDTNDEEKKVDLCNAGIMAADAKSFFRWAAKLENNNVQKEYYLTDVPKFAKADGHGCAIAVADEGEMMGVNSRVELAEAEAAMQARLRSAALLDGVGMIAPETVFLSHDTILEADVQLGPYVVCGLGVTVRSGAEIKSHSVLEGAEVKSGAVVGPHARLRPGAVIGEGAHIGNFVEVKNSTIGKGTKANHLAYLGDATVGDAANIGAGTITCNYDGFDKHRTTIGSGAFIGSDTALVAPVTVGDGAYVGAGSVITKAISKDALAVTRAEQKEIPGWADKFRTRKKAEKAAKGKK
ncbi:MAG TPA: bifunctional UDP-N-acetylglucosamine diphosphorylase/glucosamine-1-phosphate N-acetyltransferase GlmU [Rhizomicrobium sp.]|nr:bifunctional UDP-N-acetylglucosamine diphosphorylase/glucosamine-1-phosphate N-acetyltransferase GlmU [Rhizomicrobium sp.]